MVSRICTYVFQGSIRTNNIITTEESELVTLEDGGRAWRRATDPAPGLVAQQPLVLSIGRSKITAGGSLSCMLNRARPIFCHAEALHAGRKSRT
jgi:hypothetical protein